MESLFKISLIISITGIFLLLLLSNILEPKLINISEINDKMLNQKVKVQGSVIKIQDKGNFQILTIKDETGQIDIFCGCKNLTLKNNTKTNQKIEVIGRVQEYREYLQVQADKITEK